MAGTFVRYPKLFIFALAIVVYLGSLNNQFALDDLIHVVQSKEIQSLQAARESFVNPLFPGNLYRPVVTFSYALTYKFFGLNPLPYHATNILLHALVCLLIFLLLREVTPDKTALIAGTLFAIHPLHTEVVANVSGRAELLCQCLGLLGMYLSLKLLLSEQQQAWRSAALAAGAFAALLLAILSKESAVVFAALFPLLLWFRGKSDFSRTAILTTLLLVFTALAAGLAARFNVFAAGLLGPDSALSWLDNPLLKLNAAQRILQALQLLGLYFVLGVLPYPLSADYSFAHLSTQSVLQPLWGLTALLLTAALFTASLVGLRRRRLFAFAGLWFFLSFLATSNIFFCIGTIFGERLAYLPSLGPCLLLSLVFTSSSKLLDKCVFSLVLLSYAVFTHVHSYVWYNNETLQTYQIKVSPQSAKTQYNYGAVLKLKGDLRGAYRHMFAAVQIAPHYEDALLGLASVFLQQGVLSRAQAWYVQALKYNPQQVRALSGLATVFSLQKKDKEAKAAWESVLKLEPQNEVALQALHGIEQRKMEQQGSAKP